MNRRALIKSSAVAFPSLAGCATLGDSDAPEIGSTVEIEGTDCDLTETPAEISGDRAEIELVGHAEVPAGCYVVQDDAHVPSEDGRSVIELDFSRVDSGPHCLECEGHVTYQASIAVEESEITELRVLHNTPDDDTIYGTFSIGE
ncbi:hypothetical protein ACAH01_13775 [Halomicrobium sp. HM KBTZ05]|uniref:Lipoprotein n=1 Tax=Halomicrobium mukohataei TaxID=57705 RepID=A0A847UF60_9EURY|nr:hypothetical protein [Halomicrobium mukohataei]NLV09728.1 hypothetical protein [Halomicrobium mukohataei]